VLLAEHYQLDRLGGPVRSVQVWVLVSLVSVLVRMLGSFSLVVVLVVGMVSLVVLSLLGSPHLVVNTMVGGVVALSLRGAMVHSLPFVAFVLL
jgi:hypothetical protein